MERNNSPKHRNTFFIFFLVLITAIGLWFRLYHIEFGLPHSFHADEPEIAEFAIKYTYEFRDIIKNRNFYKLVPVSYVYGSFPVYLFTAATMLYSKVNNLIGASFSKTDVYIFLRSLNSVLSLIIIPAGAALYYKLFRDKFGSLITAALLSFNWKLIVNAHYLNADIIVTLLLSVLYLLCYEFYKSPDKSLDTLFIGTVLGLAAGTKITALLSLPLILILFLHKKAYLQIAGVLLTALAVFMATNPFSFIFANDFAYRIYSMRAKEAGMVFDSIDTGYFKYIFSLEFLSTPLVLILSVAGAAKAFARKENRSLHIFLVGNVLIYVLFFSLGSRRVDRWLLPILPIVLVYSAYGIRLIFEKTSWWAGFGVLSIMLALYMRYPAVLLAQFREDTPKSSAYLWARDNLPQEDKKYTITQEGLDPMNKLQNSTVQRFEVYVSEGAQYSRPYQPEYFDYIFLSSRPFTNVQRREIAESYPDYYSSWKGFEDEITTSKRYELVNSFTVQPPNLIDVSNVYVYKNNNSIPVSPGEPFIFPYIK